jgi:hypothetical protein
MAEHSAIPPQHSERKMPEGVFGFKPEPDARCQKDNFLLTSVI